MDELESIIEDSAGDHRYKVYKWDNSDGWKDDIVEEIGSKVREIYAGYEDLQEIVEGEKDELGFDMSRVRDCLSSLLETGVPDSSQGGFVSSPRADFPEIIASLSLESLHDTVIPVDLVEKRDTLDKPGRGVDVIGYEEVDGDLHLVLCEVKGSSEASNPPQVVTGTDDSMDEQLKDLVLNEEKIVENLMVIFRKAKDKVEKENIGKLMVSINDSEGSTKIVLCPFLVRELEKYDDSDYQVFKDDVKDFEPYNLRFLAVCFDDDLTSLSEEVYSFASEEEVA